MPLVDYTSDSDSDSSPDSNPGTVNPGGAPPPRKKPRRTSTPSRPDNNTTTTTTALPPLPPSFHDLYASTVRTATRDDPSLHQGRVRQTPHVAGSWPSHVYIEWHPPGDVHALLAGLVARLREEWRQRRGPTGSIPVPVPVPVPGEGGGEGGGDEGTDVTSLLVSDLGAPLPLHISLSRPLALAQADKDAFLRGVRGALPGAGVGFAPLRCGPVEWHRTGESGRSFLVVRVRSCPCAAPAGSGDGDGDGEEKNPNPELTELLRRCNGVARRFGQPELYRWAEEQGERKVGDAFHVSIAWSFAEPTEELKRATDRVFGERSIMEQIQQVEIPVEGVKVKIGNVVTHVAFTQPGRRASMKGPKNILGL